MPSDDFLGRIHKASPRAALAMDDESNVHVTYEAEEPCDPVLACFDSGTRPGEDAPKDPSSFVDRLYNYLAGPYRRVPVDRPLQRSSSPYGLTYEQATRPGIFEVGLDGRPVEADEEIFVDVDEDVVAAEREVEPDELDEASPLKKGAVRFASPAPPADEPSASPPPPADEPAVRLESGTTPALGDRTQVQAYLDASTPGKFEELGDESPGLRLAYPPP